MCLWCWRNVTRVFPLVAQLEYGEDAWREVVRLARCKWYEFNTHHIYPDGLMPELAAAAAELLTDPADRTGAAGGSAEPTADTFMRYFGRCFVRFFSNLGYDAPIRATGRYFCEFLKNVDNLHLQMRFAYPKMKSPSMYTSHVDRNGCVLVYRSTRRGFMQYFMGERASGVSRARRVFSRNNVLGVRPVRFKSVSFGN